MFASKTAEWAGLTWGLEPQRVALVGSDYSNQFQWGKYLPSLWFFSSDYLVLDYQDILVTLGKYTKVSHFIKTKVNDGAIPN